MPVQYYRDPGDGLFKAVPISGSEEVHVGPNAPTDPNIEWWIDTDDTSNQGISVADADARYVPQAQNVPTGFRNVIRNGDMSVAQRGNGPWTTYGYICVDGWYLDGYVGTPSMSRVIPALGLGSPQLSYTVSGHGAADSYARYAHRVEGVATLAGQATVFSFNARAASGTPRVVIEAEQVFGSGGSAVVGVQSATVTLSTTMQRYSVALNIPSVVGKTEGTNSYVAITMWLSSGTNFAARAPIGIQNNTFYMTDFQWEAGTVATPFERLPIQQQLSWCQRYFYRLGTHNQNQPVPASTSYFRFAPIAFMISGGQATALGYHPVTMRGVPAVSNSSPISNIYLSSSSTAYNTVTSIIATPSAMSAFTLSIDIAVSPATLPANVPLLFLQNGAASPAYIDFSAEL